MNPRLARTRLAAPLLLLTCLALRTVSAQAELGGTSWRLVRFQGSDDTALTPGASQKYTIAFETDGRVSVRIDCNQGRGTWKSAGPNQLEFGPLALTRMMCPAGSLHDRIVKHWRRGSSQGSGHRRGAFDRTDDSCHALAAAPAT